MALLDQLEADPSLCSDDWARVHHRGRIGGRTVEVAVAQDGRARLRLMSSGDSTLRFGTRAQMPRTPLQTGDAQFDDAIGVLGDPVGLIRLGVVARKRITAWLAVPKRWVTDTEAGGDDIAAADLDAVAAEAETLLESLAPPGLAEMLEMRLTAPESLRALLENRLEVRLTDARDLRPIFRVLASYRPGDRLRWLAALGGQIAHHPTEVLALLPQPIASAYDRQCLQWAATHPVAADHVTALARESHRRMPLLKGLRDDPEGLQFVFARMPHDAAAVADIESVVPATTAGRLARVEALGSRPAGDPLALRTDLRVANPALRAAVSKVIQRHLPVWLSDPRTAALVLGDLGLAESNGAMFLEMVERKPGPALVELLARTPFAKSALQLRRLELLARLPDVPPLSISDARGSVDPRHRAAADAILDAHLPRWLADPTAAKALRGIGALGADLEAKVLALCRAQPCPGGVQLLAAMQFRAQSDRVALIGALALTGSPDAESPLLMLISSGYAVRLACVAALGAVGGKASLRALQSIAGEFFVETVLKETAQRSVAQIEARIGGGAGALSMATADGRLSIPDD